MPRKEGDSLAIAISRKKGKTIPVICDRHSEARCEKRPPSNRVRKEKSKTRNANLESQSTDYVAIEEDSGNLSTIDLDIGNVSITTDAKYLEAIKHVVPQLAEMFSSVLPEAIEKALEERSTDELIVLIDAGRFAIEIAQLWRVTVDSLTSWIAADADRLARAKLARKNQAVLWDWVALQVLLHSPSDRVEIARAEKIARHCRWRAEIINRDDYGKRTKITHVDQRNARELTTHELEVIARGGVLRS